MKKFSVILAVALLAGLNAEAQVTAQAFQPTEETVNNADTAVVAKPLSLEEKLAAKKAAVHAKMMAKKAELGVKPETDAAYNDKIADAIVVVKTAEPVVADKPVNAEVIGSKENAVENIAKQKNDIAEAVKTDIDEGKAQIIETAGEVKDVVAQNIEEAKANIENAVEEVTNNPVPENVEVTEAVSETGGNIVEEAQVEAVETIAPSGDEPAGNINENKEGIAEAINEVKEDVQQTQSDLDSLEEMLGE